jgi:predicted ATPase
VILTLLVYAIADTESARKKNLNMGKGILLTGPVGCGKTTLMSLVNRFFPKSRQPMPPPTCRPLNWNHCTETASAAVCGKCSTW